MTVEYIQREIELSDLLEVKPNKHITDIIEVVSNIFHNAYKKVSFKHNKSEWYDISTNKLICDHHMLDNWWRFDYSVFGIPIKKIYPDIDEDKIASIVIYIYNYKLIS